MRSIIAASLRFRLLVVAVAAGVLAVGIVQLRDTPVDVLPEFTPPYAEIQTEALGLSAEEVEELITVPLEADLLNGVEGVDVIRSQSLPSLSSIVMVFEPGTDVYRARQLIQERLTQAHALPNVSAPPTLLQPLSSSSRVLMIGLSSDQLTPIERSVIARWTLRPRLMGVPGVANVSVWGLRDQQLQIQVDPEQLRDRGVTLNQVIRTAGNAQAVSPLSFLEASTPGTGGFIETPQQRLQVRNVLDQLADPGDLGQVPVEGTNGRLRLTDVADVRIDHQPLIGDTVVEGAEGPLLVIEKFPGANTREVTAGVEDALEKLRPGLAGMQTDTSVFRPASYIDEATGNLKTAIIIGGALAAFALLAFLARWRTVLVALVTVPVALVAAALVLDATGETFNAISFAGLAAALAIVVDEAVAGADAIGRRLQEARAGAQVATGDVVRDAAVEVRTPLVYATLIALLAIVPVAVMQGRPGAFLQPLVLAYALAVVAAMLVALTLAPALSLVLASRGRLAAGGPPLMAAIVPRFRRALGAAARHPRAVLAVAGACLLAGLVAIPFAGTPLVPAFKDRDVLIHVEAEPGTSAPRMTAIAAAMSRELQSVPGVDDVGAHVGRAIAGDARVDVNSGDVWVSLDPEADYADTLSNIRDAAARVDGVSTDVAGYAMQKVRDVGALLTGTNDVRGRGLDVLTGADEPIVVRVYGPDLDTLRREAERIRRLVAGVDGVRGAHVPALRTQPSVEIAVDLARAQARGIKPGDVRRAEATLLQGIQVGSVFQDQKVFDVVVRGVPQLGASVDDVRGLLVDRPGGGHVRIGDVADVRIVQSPISIDRDAVSRHVDVRADVAGRGVDAVAGDIERRLADTALPLEYHAEVVPSTTGEEVGSTRVLLFALGALLAGYLLLQAALGSWRLAAFLAATIPVALSGGVVAAVLAGWDLSLGTLVGLLAVFGVAVRIVLVLARRLQDLERRERRAFGPELVEAGAVERLPAILTTTVALALFALPFVVLGAPPGLEVAHAAAIALLGGLATTAFVTLFVLPAAYLRFHRATPPGGLAADEEHVERWTAMEAPAPVATGLPGNGGGALR